MDLIKFCIDNLKGSDSSQINKYYAEKKVLNEKVYSKCFKMHLGTVLYMYLVTLRVLWGQNHPLGSWCSVLCVGFTGRQVPLWKKHSKSASTMCCPQAKDFKDHDDTMMPFHFPDRAFYHEKKQTLLQRSAIESIKWNTSASYTKAPCKQKMWEHLKALQAMMTNTLHI